jgi:hypothetical protein
MPLPMQRSNGLTDARAITVRPVVDFIGTIREHSIQLPVQYASRCSLWVVHYGLLITGLFKNSKSGLRTEIKY